MEIISKFGKYIGKSRTDKEVLSLIKGMDEIDDNTVVTYFENPAKGISILFEDSILESIFLHGEGKDGFREYKDLLGPILFSSGKAGIRDTLGVPESSKVDDKVPGNEEIWGWDKYNIQGFSLHFTYNKDQEIIMIALEKWC